MFFFSLQGADVSSVPKTRRIADWPAEPRLELLSDKWVVFERPIQYSHLIGTAQASKTLLNGRGVGVIEPLLLTSISSIECGGLRISESTVLCLGI